MMHKAIDTHRYAAMMGVMHKTMYIVFTGGISVQRHDGRR
jgi:hypothetical protein